MYIYIDICKSSNIYIRRNICRYVQICLFIPLDIPQNTFLKIGTYFELKGNIPIYMHLIIYRCSLYMYIYEPMDIDVHICSVYYQRIYIYIYMYGYIYIDIYIIL